LEVGVGFAVGRKKRRKGSILGKVEEDLRLPGGSRAAAKQKGENGAATRREKVSKGKSGGREARK